MINKYFIFLLFIEIWAGIFLYSSVLLIVKVRKADIDLEYNLGTLNNRDDYKELERVLSKCRKYAIIIVSISFLLSLAFGIIYYYQNSIDKFSGILSVTIETGIHIPIVLFITGLIITAYHKNITKILFNDNAEEFQYCRDDTVNALIKISTVLDICALCIDYKMGLMILAIILGKHIWMDTSNEYRGLKEFFLHIKSWLHGANKNDFCYFLDIYSFLVFSLFIFGYSLIITIGGSL